MTGTAPTVRRSTITMTSVTNIRVSPIPEAFLITKVHTAASLAARSRMRASHTAADFPAARRPAFTPARSAASIMEASRMHFPPAETGVSAEGATAVEGSTAVEAATLEEAGTDEHQASGG